MNTLIIGGAFFFSLFFTGFSVFPRYCTTINHISMRLFTRSPKFFAFFAADIF